MKGWRWASVRVVFAFLVIVFAAAGYWSSVEGVSSQEHPAVGPPQYRIYDLGIVQAGDSASQGFGVSPNGFALGRSFRTNGAQAFIWSLGGGTVGLPNLPGRSYAVANSASCGNTPFCGIVVGTAATTSFGSGRLPVYWQNGVVSQFTLPAGQTLGDAYSVNSSAQAVGSVDAGTTQRGALYYRDCSSCSTIISATTNTGCFFVTAYGINDSGLVVGYGWDPNNAARNVGMMYNISTNSATEVGGLAGGSTNGAIAFGVSNTGYVVGSTMMNQGSGIPFIWSPDYGMTPIPLASGTSQGSARAVNSAGWVVGQDSSAFSIPFLYDGTATYRLQDLIPANSGWDLSMNTSSSALGISDQNVIVGTGVFNGQTHGYAMFPAKNAVFDYDGDGRADVSVFRSGTWYLQNSSSGFGAVSWGLPTDKIAPADYDGDGKTDIAVYRPSEGNWYILKSSNGTLFGMHFGISEDLPSPGYFDVDPGAELAVYRPSTGTWWIRTNVGPIFSARFGTSEDKPVVGDWDGDGRSDLGVFRPSNGTWYYSYDLVDPSHNFISLPFGASTDLVTPADLDGDGRTDVAVYRPSNGVWYWLSSRNANAFNAVQFGTSEDIPATADFDGDGRADISVFRPSSGVWYRLNSSNGGFAAIQFGTSGDRPTPAAFRY